MLKFYAYRRELANGVSRLETFTEEAHNSVQEVEKAYFEVMPDVPDVDQRRLRLWGNYFFVSEISKEQALKITAKSLDLAGLLKELNKKTKKTKEKDDGKGNN